MHITLDDIIFVSFTLQVEFEYNHILQLDVGIKKTQNKQVVEQYTRLPENKNDQKSIL